MKKKKWLTILLSLAFTITSALAFSSCNFALFSLFAGDKIEDAIGGTEGLAYQKIEGKEEYAVVGIGTATGAKIVIPSTFNKLPVTEIGERAFANSLALTDITIPNSITTIAPTAFDGCDNLNYTTYKNGSYLGNLLNPYFYLAGPASNDVTDITVHAKCKIFNLQNTHWLLNINFEGDITSISDSAFKGCVNLTSITIPSSVTSIGDSAFAGCTGLTNITIPNSVAWIYDSAFSYCKKLTNIIIPNSVTAIGAGIFYECTSLKSVTIPESVTWISDEMFYGCTGLTNITLPNSVTVIGVEAFYNCTGLTNITIPNSVKTIHKNTFGGCKGLTSITIPDSVTSLATAVFEDCTGLTSVTCPDFALAYIAKTNLQKVVITSGDNIPSYAFQSARNLTSVTIPSSVTSIGDSAFSNCYHLTDVYYNGTAEEWAQIEIGQFNDELANITIHYND